MNEVLAESFIPELETDFLSSKDIEERSRIVADICTVSRTLNEEQKAKMQFDSDANKIAFEKERLDFEKERLAFEKDKCNIEDARCRAEATGKREIEMEKLVFEKDRLDFEKDKLNLDTQRFEYEVEANARSRRWDVVKTVGGWILAGVGFFGGLAFKNYTMKKSFQFEEDGTLASMTSRQLFRDWFDK